jgi:murein DD-endopeptidase MepM/ murein hydrolase activator NlpD
MSAITYKAPFSAHDHQADHNRRYHTTVRVLVHSHSQRAEDPPIDLSADVLSCTVGKTTKGVGQANLTVVPTRNYLNLLFPGDVVNIYFDISDNSGWTRTFFGYVDLVEETYEVQETGTPRTAYRIVCSDFTKAFARTEIYFNPHIAGRPDLAVPDIAAANIGGIIMLTRGIVMHGSPPDMVLNLLHLLFGFGSQMSLPENYRPRSLNLGRIRNLRRNYVFGRLGENVRREAAAVGGWERLRQRIVDEATADAQSLSENASDEETLNATAERYDISTSELSSLNSESGAEGLRRVLTDRAVLRQFFGGDRPPLEAQGLRTIYESTHSQQVTLLDVVDLYTFVERRAMDGYHAGRSVYDQQGSVLSIARNYSHEIMNELMFDLRPLSLPAEETNESYSQLTESLVDGSTFSLFDDEIGGNVGAGDVPTGIEYVPALVMREYPFSTISSIDAQNVNISLSRGRGGPAGAIGVLHFGAIFSDKPNVAGRHVITMPNINVADIDAGMGVSPARKHLDVAVISEKEITRTQFSRSDTDHFNLLEFWSDSVLGEDMKFYMQDLLPIVTPIHIMRHGLRRRTLTTTFARYDVTTASNAQNNEANQEAEEEQERQAAPAAVSRETPNVSPGSLGLPLTSVREDGTTIARYSGADIHAWGYRAKTRIGPGGSWVFHNGIDICPILPRFDGNNADNQIEIKAIADGDVVVSAPDGVSSGYGNVVVIRHNFGGQRRYSVYAHLARRTVGLDLEQATGRRRDRSRYFAQSPGIRGGGRNASFQPVRVRKGDVIGYMGRTGFGRMGVHLHFEIDTVFPPRNDGVTPRYHFAPPPADFDPSAGAGSQRGTWASAVYGPGSEPSAPAGARSEDPVAFYAAQGINLQRSIRAGRLVRGSAGPSEPDEDPTQETESDDWDATFDDGEDTPDRSELGDNDLQRQLDSAVRQDAAVTGATDTVVSRRQISRWALLQDCWFQHNIEYLSGTIEMRGAPEIRAGYRLDLVERNMSFYVEGVNHTWQFPNRMVTSLQVVRGQPNNPYPLYVYPATEGFSEPRYQRQKNSRLAEFALVPDPLAVRRRVAVRGGNLASPETSVEYNATDMMTDLTVQSVNGGQESLHLRDASSIRKTAGAGYGEGVERHEPAVISSDLERDRILHQSELAASMESVQVALAHLRRHDVEDQEGYTDQANNSGEATSSLPVSDLAARYLGIDTLAGLD